LFKKITGAFDGLKTDRLQVKRWRAWIFAIVWLINDKKLKLTGKLKEVGYQSISTSFVIRIFMVYIISGIRQGLKAILACHHLINEQSEPQTNLK